MGVASHAGPSIDLTTRLDGGEGRERQRKERGVARVVDRSRSRVACDRMALTKPSLGAIAG